MKTKNIIFTSIVVIALALGAYLWQCTIHLSSSRPAHQKEIWYCPMHPQILYDHPGICPICGMALVKKFLMAQARERSLMDYTAVTLTNQQQQLIGVRTIIVDKKPLVKTIRAAGQYEGEVFAQVFEDDLEFIKVGQKVIVEVPAYQARYLGSVNSIDSMLDQVSRTIRVRIWLKKINQKQFKTNMFVNVELPIILGESVFVPRDAVMDTGVRKIVFVQKKEGIFQPQEIQTGFETDDGYEVKSGLKMGDRIVVSGNFLLDSESRLQAGQDAASLEGDLHGK